MGKTVITTSHEPNLSSTKAAKQAALSLQMEFVERNRMSLEKIRQHYNCDNILVVHNDHNSLHTIRGEYSFHPSMSVLRIKSLEQGKPDHMVEAMSLIEGDSVLDCTLGLASDAIVASHVIGVRGCIVGLESSPVLAYIVKSGLEKYRSNRQHLELAMSRIKVINEESHRYLAAQPTDSFDIVYFDPMFRYPRIKSSSMEPLRDVFNPDSVNQMSLDEAVRVARKRVIMKENFFSSEFKRLGFSKVIGGKHSPFAFGIIDIREVANE